MQAFYGSYSHGVNEVIPRLREIIERSAYGQPMKLIRELDVVGRKLAGTGGSLAIATQMAALRKAYSVDDKDFIFKDDNGVVMEYLSLRSPRTQLSPYGFARGRIPEVLMRRVLADSALSRSLVDGVADFDVRVRWQFARQPNQRIDTYGLPHLATCTGRPSAGPRDSQRAHVGLKRAFSSRNASGTLAACQRGKKTLKPCELQRNRHSRP